MRVGYLSAVLAAAWLMVAVPASAAFKIRSANLDGEPHLVFADVAKYYGMSFRLREDTVVCQSKYSLMTFTVNDRRATINGVKVMLCRMVRRSGSHAMISEVDFRRTIDPLLRHHALSGHGVRTIVIDPGHGGADPGALGKSSKEKEINLAVARIVAHNLRRRGYQVHLTRSSDVAVSLGARVKAAERLRPDLFVSLHVNAAATSSAQGVETFALTPVGASASHGGDIKTRATPGNLHDRENIRLAYEIQKQLLHYTKAEDRGVKRANFLVIRDAPCPAALVEMGFISHAGEESRLRSAAYHRLLAAGIIDGIIAYDNALRTR
jgi:N-acetylmuramoyl-L-alanine amidase